MPRTSKKASNFVSSSVPDQTVRLNKNRNNAALKGRILSQKKMKEAGFIKTDCGWRYFAEFPLDDQISFNVYLNTSDLDNPAIEVLDENYLQPYDYQYYIFEAREHNKEPSEFMLNVQKFVEEQMEHIQNAGIITGHVKGAYI